MTPLVLVCRVGCIPCPVGHWEPVQQAMGNHVGKPSHSVTSICTHLWQQLFRYDHQALHVVEHKPTETSSARSCVIPALLLQ